MASARKFCLLIIVTISLLGVSPSDGFASWPDFPLSSDCFYGSAYGTQSLPAVARGEDNLLVVWDDERISADKDIFGARLTLSGETLDSTGFSICTAVDWQTSPEVAAGDQVYLVVWQDYRSGTNNIYGARVDQKGKVLDPDGFPICIGEWLAESPDVCWDGTNFLVVWCDDRDMISRDIYAARVTPEGAVLEANGFQISSGSFSEIRPSVAYNGLNYLVVWEVEGG